MSLLFFIAVNPSTWWGYEWFVLAVFMIYITWITIGAVAEFIKDVIMILIKGKS
jgi:hypothetical protein